MIALFHGDLDNAAKGVSSKVDVLQGLDFAGGRNRLNQSLQLDNFAGLDWRYSTVFPFDSGVSSDSVRGARSD